jgi:oleandomycin transport system permease protein
MAAATATVAAPVRGRRIGPIRTFRHTLTLGWRAVLKIRSNPEQLLDVSLQPIVFVTMFVFLFGGAIAGGNRHAYLQYVLPGIAVQTIVFGSMGTGINLNTDITKGIFDRFRSLPIARSSPLTGLITGDIVRYVVSLTIVTGYGVLLGFRFHNNPAAIAPAYLLLLVFALALCWVWVFFALLVKTPQALQGVGFVILFPLTFGSNVFVPAATMPGWLQAWVKINPVSYLSNAVRGLMLGGPVADSLWHALVWIVAILVAFVPLAVGVYRRRT